MGEGGGSAESGPRRAGVIGPLRSPGGVREVAERYPSSAMTCLSRVNWPGTEFSLVDYHATNPVAHLFFLAQVQPSRVLRFFFFSPRTSSAGACFVPSQTSLTPRSLFPAGRTSNCVLWMPPATLHIQDPAVTCSVPSKENQHLSVLPALPLR